MAKTNEVVGMNNRFTVGGIGKRIVYPYKSQWFCKCIGCVLSAITYGKKGTNLQSEIPKAFCRMSPTKVRIDVS